MIDRIIRSNRRTLGLQITPEAHVIVRAPKRASMGEIERWVHQNTAWIQKHQARRRAEQQQQISMSAEERMALELEFRARATTVIPQRVAEMAQKDGLRYQSIRISGARTRWGSCSRQGRLNFSWRLAMTPPWIIDYVVAHELAHLIHHNHSRRFWAKVGELYPDFQSARRWLRENRHRLPLA